VTFNPSLPTPAAAVAHWARETPRATAVVEGGVSCAYALLARNVAQSAVMLAAAGVAPGMLVGIECDVRYLHLVLILACEALGAAHVALTEAELTPDRDPAARCDLLCITKDGDATLVGTRIIRLSPDFVRLMSGVAVEDADPGRLDRAFPAGDIVRVGRTSGTSGRFKFVACAREPMARLLGIIPHLTRFDESRQNFIALYSFINIGTYTRCLAALRYGATVVFSTGAELAASIRTLPGCHTFLLVRDAAAVAASEQFRDGRLDTCSLRVHGGFLPAALLTALRRTVTADVTSVYSMNETSVIAVGDGPGPGTVLQGVAVRVVDAAGQDVTMGEAGRIVVRTPWMSPGYLWDAAETAARFTGGWFLTSDFGAMPEPGKLLVLGRADEMINLGGIKLSPQPIEALIREMDGVRDAVMIGLDRPDGSGDLHVFVERADPAIDSGVQAAITALLAAYVTSYSVHFESDLPRTATGKARRNMLRRMLARDGGG